MMKEFDPTIESHSELIENLKRPDEFKAVYNKIIKDVNLLEEKKKAEQVNGQFAEFSIEKVIIIRPDGENGILFKVREKEINKYPDSFSLRNEIVTIFKKHIFPGSLTFTELN